MGGGGDLVHFAELLLHAGAGLAGDGGGLVGGAPGVLHRAFDVGDGGLELVEEAVEPAGQLAEFVLAGVIEATGEVAFAAGDIPEHAGDALDRPGHAARGEPDQQQAGDGGQDADQQAGEVGGLVLGTQLGVELQCGRQQHLFGNLQQDAPGRGGGDRLEGFHHPQQAVVLHFQGLAGLEVAGQFPGVGAEGLVQLGAEQAGVPAVSREQAGRAEDADVAVAFVQLAVTGDAELLEPLQADVETHDADGLAVQLQREGDAGHEDLAVPDVIEVGVQHAGLSGFHRAGVPGVIGSAAGAGAAVGQQFLGHGFRFQRAGGGLCPVEGEAALVVAAQLRLVDEEFVLAVEGVGLEHQVEAEDLGIGFQAGAHLARQVLAQVEGVEEAFLGLLLEEQHLPGETLAVLVVVHEVALDADRLELGAGLQAQAGALLEHLAAVGLDQAGAALGLVQGRTDQQAHDGQQAEAGEQGDLPLDGQSIERHWDFLLSRRNCIRYRRRCRLLDARTTNSRAKCTRAQFAGKNYAHSERYSERF
ncbi:hypothetical protein ppKF707_3149 [Metapseudomonas furukawaii]|nr:hypothetical protein ppKF707_3149 [Pseudomonas furukawaii]